jgi:hypothetical protein
LSPTCSPGWVSGRPSSVSRPLIKRSVSPVLLTVMVLVAKVSGAPVSGSKAIAVCGAVPKSSAQLGWEPPTVQAASAVAVPTREGTGPARRVKVHTLFSLEVEMMVRVAVVGSSSSAS